MSTGGPASGPLHRWWARQQRLPPDARRYLWGAALMGLGQGAAWVHLNLFFKAAGLGEEAIGTLLAVTSVGGTLVALPAAALVERARTGRVLAGAALGFSLALALQLVVPDLPDAAPRMAICVLASLAFGVLFTVHHVAAAPFFMRAAPPDLRADLFGVAQAVETAATLVAALAVGWLAEGFTTLTGSSMRGLQIGLGVAAVATLPGVAAFARIQSAPAPAGTQSWLAPLRIADKGLLFRLTFPTAVVGLGAGLTIPFLNLYFRDRFGLEPGDIGGTFGPVEE